MQSTKYLSTSKSTKSLYFSEIGIRVGYDGVNSALDVKGTLHKK
jgi:hypothetical protein